MTGTNFSKGKSSHHYPRSLPVSEWPDADRRAWQAACRPGSRLKPGGVASYLAQVSRDDFARRYGAFLGFLQRTNRLEQHAGAATQVTVPNVEAYIADLKARVRSVTVYNYIHSCVVPRSCLHRLQTSRGLPRSRRISHSRWSPDRNSTASCLPGGSWRPA